MQIIQNFFHAAELNDTEKPQLHTIITHCTQLLTVLNNVIIIAKSKALELRPHLAALRSAHYYFPVVFVCV